MKYWIFLGILVILWGGFLFFNKQRFSEQKLMAIVETPGKFRDTTDDYCKYVTGLDPKEPDMRYVKITFVCSNKQALNTISWMTINDQTVGGVINFIKVINGINNINAKLECNVDGAKASFESKINVGNQILCKVN